MHVLLELLRPGPAVQSPPSPPSSSSRLPPLFVAPYLADDPAPPPTPGSSAALPGDFFSPLRLATVPPLTPRPASSGWIFPSWQEAEVGRGVASARGFRPLQLHRQLARPRGGLFTRKSGRAAVATPPALPAPSAPSGPVPSRPAAPGRCGRRPPAGAPPKERGAAVSVPSAARPPAPAPPTPPGTAATKDAAGRRMSPRRGH